MRITLSFLLIFFTSGMLYGQFQEITIGVVPQAQVASTEYAKDPDAAAYVIHDEGATRFIISQGELNVEFKFKSRVKVLKKAGLEWANVEIPFYQERGNREFIKDIKAFSHTYTEDQGMVVRQLRKSEIYTEEIDDNWSQIKFTIPGASAGSVIEYEYTKVSPFIRMPDWEFQGSIPVEYSGYKVNVTPFYTYQYILQGASKFDEYESYKDKRSRAFAGIKFNDMVYRMAMKDLDAFTDESYITSISDYITKIDWQLSQINYPNGRVENYMTTWPELIKELDEHDDFGKYIKGVGKQAKSLFKSDLKIEGKSKLEAAAMIERFVKEKFRWNGSHSKYAQQTAKEIMKSREGYSGDINLLLTGLYRAAGIEAYPIILSTRGHGKVKTSYPFSSFFNTVASMIVIDGNRYLTDGTVADLKFGKLPAHYLNELGLVIDQKKVDWLDISSTAPSAISTQMATTIDVDEMLLSTNFTLQMTDYDALRFRRDEDRINSRIDEEYELVSEIKSGNLKSYKRPLMYTYSVQMPFDFFEDKYYITPFFKEAITTNPFTSKERDYPIDFGYSQAREFISKFEIPEGFVVSAKPEDLSFDNSVMNFKYTTQQKGNQLVITGVYILKKAVYSPKEFNRVRHFFGQIANKFKEQIVLEEQ